MRLTERRERKREGGREREGGRKSREKKGKCDGVRVSWKMPGNTN